MFPCTINTFINTLCIFIAVTFANGQDRQLVSKLNPGCEHCDATLIYTRAQGSHDTIHQIWDFTHHVPSVVYVIGPVNSNVTITWHDSYPDQFLFTDKFDGNKTYSFAAAVESIIEYNDLKDNGQFEPGMPKENVQRWPLDNTKWRRSDMVLTDKEAVVTMMGEDSTRSGVIEMKLDILPFQDYALDLPHLIHTANSTLVDVQLVNFTESPGFNASRFALRLVLASSDNSSTTWTKDMRKSLDDEHTPGVFEIIEMRSARARDGAFVQFRPVAYTQRERGVSSSTNAYITGFNRSSLPRHSVLPRLYRNYFEGNASLVVQDAVVSFGLAGDGYYKQHNFTAWSFTIGYGAPPLEGFSLFVMIIISIGLGVPTLLALAGVTYMLARRCRQRNPPARFTNDE